MKKNISKIIIYRYVFSAKTEILQGKNKLHGRTELPILLLVDSVYHNSLDCMSTNLNNSTGNKNFFY